MDKKEIVLSRVIVARLIAYLYGLPNKEARGDESIWAPFVDKYSLVDLTNLLKKLQEVESASTNLQEEPKMTDIQLKLRLFKLVDDFETALRVAQNTGEDMYKTKQTLRDELFGVIKSPSNLNEDNDV